MSTNAPEPPAVTPPFGRDDYWRDTVARLGIPDALRLAMGRLLFDFHEDHQRLTGQLLREIYEATQLEKLMPDLAADPDVAEFDAALAAMKEFGFEGQFALEVVRFIRPFFVPRQDGDADVR